MLTFVAAGFVILASWCMQWWMIVQIRGKLEHDIDKLSGTLHRVERILGQRASESLSLAAEGEKSTQISPETQAAIRSKLSTLLGSDIRIRSVKLLEPEAQDVATAWVTQGRIAVCSSHQLHGNRG